MSVPYGVYLMGKKLRAATPESVLEEEEEVQVPANKGRPYLQRQQGWQERRRLRIGARGSGG